VQCAGLLARADGGAHGGDDEDVCVRHGNSLLFWERRDSKFVHGYYTEQFCLYPELESQ